MSLLKDTEQVLLERLTSYFSAIELEALARESKFIQRSTSRLTGQNFLLVNILYDSPGSETTFQDMCDWLNDECSVSISKQGLWERYNTDAVRYMRMCFERCLSQVFQGRTLEYLRQTFSGINLSDATGFQIPDKLRAFYPGTACESGVKLMYDYDLINGRFKGLWIGGATDNDCSFLGQLEMKIEPNELFIKDLGFYKNEHFINIDRKGAYFLSRCKGINTFHKRNAKGNWQSIPMEEMVAGVENLTEFEVYLGKGQDKIPIRLIVEPVSDEIWERRNKKARKAARSHNAQINPRTLILNRYSFWITNVPSTILPKEMVKEVYLLRWQIELIFKVWKSLLKIDEVQQLNIFRFECYIYAKLIQALLSGTFENLIQQADDIEEEEISTWKATKIF